MPSPRYAIYYTPPPFSALARFGAGVLGYDCFDAVDVPHKHLEGIDLAVLKLMTLEPRRYGFHATLVAPFHLGRHSEDDLMAAVDGYAQKMLPLPIGHLTVSLLGGFVALTPAEPNPGIASFAAACVEAFHPLRAPLSAADRERRIKAGLTPRQIELLDRWGYPYVHEEFRFHMTLSGSLPEEQRAATTAALSKAFAPRAADHFEIDALSLMKQDDSGARFRVLRRYRLRGKPKR
jgi:putative phosphonate metabolism protein